MRIIKPSTVRRWAKEKPIAAAFFMRWLTVAHDAQWSNLMDVRRSFPHANGVKVRSGSVVLVFNVAKTGYRLIAALHYNVATVYTLRFLSHSEYEKGAWKDQL